MPFTGDYSLRPIPGMPREFAYHPDAADPLTYYSAGGRRIVMGRQFTTDGATTPFFVWGFRGFHQWDWAEAAILHDHLWEMRKSGVLTASFKRSNKLMQEAIVSLGWNRWIALAVFWAVTLFGWYWWLAGENVEVE